jgi:hypothetical protein
MVAAVAGVIAVGAALAFGLMWWPKNRSAEDPPASFTSEQASALATALISGDKDQVMTAFAVPAGQELPDELVMTLKDSALSLDGESFVAYEDETATVEGTMTLADQGMVLVTVYLTTVDGQWRVADIEVGPPVVASESAVPTAAPSTGVPA